MSESGRIAVIAGGGLYPPELARLARRGGRDVYVAALDGVADPSSFPGCEVQVYRLGQLGRLLDELRRRQITQLAMVGALPRPSFGSLMPEASTLRYLPYFARAFQGGDDHLLSHVVRFFEQQGFTVRGPAEIAPEITAPAGPLGGLKLPAERLEAVRRGFALVDAMSPFDVGQGLVLADHRVVAIEAAEGTDEMIRRVGGLIAAGRLRIERGDGILLKAPKAGQDLRVDMPAIGPDTLRGIAAVGLSGIVVRARTVLVGDAEALGAQADKLGLYVEGVA